MNSNQVKEKELMIPALKLVKENPNITTSELIKHLEKVVKLYPKDKQKIKNRNDNYFSQTVRNLCGSHLPTNEFGKCVDVKKVNNTNCFVINEYGLNKLSDNLYYELEDITEDEIFQNEIQTVESYTEKDLTKSINRVPELNNNSASKRYKTDPRISKSVLKLRDYKCEYGLLINSEHFTFISKSGVIFMEGHHLLPMKAQNDYKVNIDRPENIISLCPICHRAIHNACAKEKIVILKKLYEYKKEELKNIGIDISFEDLYNKYYI